MPSGLVIRLTCWLSADVTTEYYRLDRVLLFNICMSGIDCPRHPLQQVNSYLTPSVMFLTIVCITTVWLAWKDTPMKVVCRPPLLTGSCLLVSYGAKTSFLYLVGVAVVKVARVLHAGRLRTGVVLLVLTLSLLLSNLLEGVTTRLCS